MAKGTSLAPRIERRLRELGISAIDAANSEGLERNYIRDLLEGKKTSFSQSMAPKVAKALQWGLADLLGDQALPKRRDDDDITRVPLLDSVAAGKLSGPLSQIDTTAADVLSFSGLGRGEWFALRVEGDSMDRLSPEGSVIIVNKADRVLLPGKCYVFSLRGLTTYKVWQARPDRISPLSTNPSHQPVFIKKRDMEVVGRVRRTVLDL